METKKHYQTPDMEIIEVKSLSMLTTSFNEVLQTNEEDLIIDPFEIL